MVGGVELLWVGHKLENAKYSDPNKWLRLRRRLKWYKQISEQPNPGKSYFDKRRKPLKFNVGDHVYLRVSPTRGVQLFVVRGKSAPCYVVQLFVVRGKLAPCYVGPYEIIEECGPVAYWLWLPSRLDAIHDVFHISQVKKCVRVPTEIIEQQEISVEPDLSYSEYPLKILDRKERGTRRKVVKMYKIRWSHHTKEEAT